MFSVRISEQLYAVWKLQLQLESHGQRSIKVKNGDFGAKRACVEILTSSLTSLVLGEETQSLCALFSLSVKWGE